MCHWWCFCINHEIAVFQKLLSGAKQEDLDAVKGALAQGANVDVGVFLHGSIPCVFLVKDNHCEIAEWKRLCECRHKMQWEKQL